MKAQSFREILAEFLEEESPVSPLKTVDETAFATQIPLSSWSFDLFPGPRSSVKTAYPSASRPVVKVPEVPAKTPPPPPEKLIALSDLNADHKILTDTLIRCGASELESGVSVRRLKKAHRRLVKRLHPDLNAGASVESFLLVQHAYGELLGALPAYESAA